MLEKERLGNFGIKKQKLVTKAERIKKEGKNAESHTEMSYLK